MKIQVTCDFCKATIAVSAENAGKKARCPKCREIISIPLAESSPAPPQKPRRPSSSPETSPPEPPVRKARKSGDAPPVDASQNHGAAPKKRKKEPAPGDVLSQPLSSYSSPAIEEHEYELYGIEPKRGGGEGQQGPYRGKREAGSNNGYTPPGYKIPLIMAAVGLGSALVLGGIGLAVPPVGYAGAGIGGVIGFLLSLWGGLKILSNAFEDSFVTGFLYLLCGPYALYFLFSRWEINQHPFFINLMGTLVLFVSMGVGAAVGANVTPAVAPAVAPAGN